MISNRWRFRGCGSSMGLVFLFLVWLIVLLPDLADAAAKKSRDANQLQHFYIVRMYWSDYLPDWHDHITDVRSDGENVNVRYIQLALVNQDCSDYVNVK